MTLKSIEILTSKCLTSTHLLNEGKPSLTISITFEFPCIASVKCNGRFPLLAFKTVHES